jgi:hypothetical protein
MKFLEELGLSILLIVTWGSSVFFMVYAALFPSAAIHCAFVSVLVAYLIFVYLETKGLRYSLWMAMLFLMPITFLAIGLLWLVIRWFLGLLGIELPGL